MIAVTDSVNVYSASMNDSVERMGNIPAGFPKITVQADVSEKSASVSSGILWNNCILALQLLWVSMCPSLQQQMCM